MMMQAFKEGATEGGVVYKPDAETLNFTGKDGYKPNPGNLWEVGQRLYWNPAFLRGIPDDSFIKIFFDGLQTLPKRDCRYKIIFMVRDAQEILNSIERVEQHILENDRSIISSEQPYTPFSVYRSGYKQEDIDHAIGICEARIDMDLFVVDYGEVVRDPLTVFERLAEGGIPIDPAICAQTIDPKFYRSRRDECPQLKAV
jgi:hypothetical protein